MQRPQNAQTVSGKCPPGYVPCITGCFGGESWPCCMETYEAAYDFIAPPGWESRPECVSCPTGFEAVPMFRHVGSPLHCAEVPIPGGYDPPRTAPPTINPACLSGSEGAEPGYIGKHTPPWARNLILGGLFVAAVAVGIYAWRS